MKTKAQMIRAEPKMRMPDCRRLSPKNLKTLPEKTCPATWTPKRPISPKESSQPRGTSSQAFTGRSPDRLQFGVGGEDDRADDELEEEDRHQGDHHRLVDGAADAGRA